MLHDRLTLGSRLTFVGGKGGVGKTTIAAALAVELADSGEPVAILSVDPAHSLADALALPLSAELTPLPNLPLLVAAELDAHLEHRRFVAESGRLIEQIIERGTYLDQQDVEQISTSSLPGVDELAALLSLRRLIAVRKERIIIDTAPTGHTLRLLELPEIALEWVGALEAMNAKHVAVASALAGSYGEDEASAFLRELRQDLRGLSDQFRDSRATRFIIVTTSEEVVLPETYRLQDRLQALRIAPGGIVVNRYTSQPAALNEGIVTIPLLNSAPVGLTGLRLLSEAAGGSLSTNGGGTTGSQTNTSQFPLQPFELPPNRSLYFVIGKGGVGKSTAAAALAVRLADAGSRVLLLSIDPAGSLSEVLGEEIGAAATQVQGVPQLEARQLDAHGTWTRFVARYRADVEEVFAGLLSESTSATMDRVIVDRLIDLSPPGLDELMALMEVIDANEDRVYDALVVDTAPTGHLLRLLELPAMALEWTHSMLRLLLKYREVVQLSGAGERVLKLARSLRKVQALLRDPEQTLFLTVTTPDSLSLAETGRLISRLQELGLPRSAVLVNQALGRSRVLRQPLQDVVTNIAAVDASLSIGLAPSVERGPTGAEALRSFINDWRSANRPVAS